MKLNKTFKKVLSVVLALAMVVTSITVYNTTAKAATGFENVNGIANADGTITVTMTKPDNWTMIEAYILEGEHDENAEVTADDAAISKNEGGWNWNTQGQQYGGVNNNADNILKNAKGDVIKEETTYTVILIAYTAADVEITAENRKDYLGTKDKEVDRVAVTVTVPKSEEAVTGQTVPFGEVYFDDKDALWVFWNDKDSVQGASTYMSYIVEGETTAEEYVRNAKDYPRQGLAGYCWSTAGTNGSGDKRFDAATTNNDSENTLTLSPKGTYTVIVDAYNAKGVLVGSGSYVIKPKEDVEPVDPSTLEKVTFTSGTKFNSATTIWAEWADVEGAPYYKSYIVEGTDVDAISYERKTADYASTGGYVWSVQNNNKGMLQSHCDNIKTNNAGTLTVDNTKTYTVIVDAYAEDGTWVATGSAVVAPIVTYDVTVDGEVVASVEAGNTYTLGGNAQGYTDGTTNYKAGTAITVTDNMSFTSININLKVVGASIRKDPLGIRFKTTVTGKDSAVGVKYGTRIGSADIPELEDLHITTETWATDDSYIAALVGFNANQVNAAIYAKGYAVVPYSDGTEVEYQFEEISSTIKTVADKAGWTLE